VTALLIPDGIPVKKFLQKLRESDSIVLAEGQDHMKEKIFRIGHLGFFSQEDLVQTMDALERQLHEFGFVG